MLHAFTNAIDESCLEDDEMTMLVGPSAAANLLEVGVVTARDFDALVIVHAVKVRDKFPR